MADRRSGDPLETHGVLYRWPSSAKFGRVVPKTKFYEHAHVSAALREKFVADVQRVTWAYKLADETIRMRGTEAVPEIQVFVVDAKDDGVADDVLAAIDKAVPFPIIFEIARGLASSSQVRTVAAYKQLGRGNPKIARYLTSQWEPADSLSPELRPTSAMRSRRSAIRIPMPSIGSLWTLKY